MFYKLIDSAYRPETGESIATIRTKYGDFVGYAKVHPEDSDIESEFTGCAFAETRAIAKAHKVELKEKRIKLKAYIDLEKEVKQMKGYNPHSVESRRLRRKIYELDKEIKEKADILKNLHSKIIEDSERKRKTLQHLEEVHNRRMGKTKE